LTGDGTSSAHEKIMKTKAKKYSEAIISSSLQRGESSMAYNSYYMTSLSYGTAATSLDVKECEEIKRPIVNAILPKMGVNRNSSRNVVFGTSKYGRLGLDHLSTVQVFAQLQYVIVSLRTQDTTGDLYQMLLEYTQLECNTATLILEAGFTRYEPTILTKN
jgi:folate-dependent tRNA-U54 methylase TrmFO/GidA